MAASIFHEFYKDDPYRDLRDFEGWEGSLNWDTIDWDIGGVFGLDPDLDGGWHNAPVTGSTQTPVSADDSTSQGTGNAAIEAIYGGAPRFDPNNRQYGLGNLRNLLGAGITGQIATRGGSSPLGQPIATAEAPVSSTDAGGGGPRLPVNPVSTPVQSPEASTDAGSPGPRQNLPAPTPTLTPTASPSNTGETGTPLRAYPGVTQTPVNSPEQSTDGGGGGPRLGTNPGNGGDGGGDGTGNGGGGSGINLPELGDFFNMNDFDRREPQNQDNVWDWAEYGTPRTAQTLSGILDAESVINPRQISGAGRDYNDVLAQFMGGYRDTATGIGEDDIDLDRKKREEMMSFFSGGGYGDLLGSMQESDPGTFGMINDLQEQSGMMSNQISSLIGNAGKLNERERSNVQDQTRALFGARGRGTDTAAIATEIGDVLEAERFDRNQDLGMASNLMGQQGQLAGLSSGLQNQFVNSFLGANQSIMPGLGTAEGMKGTASSMGIDPGAIFNLSLGERGFRSEEEMGRESADAIREAGYWSAATPLIQGASGSIFDWIGGLLNNGQNGQGA